MTRIDAQNLQKRKTLLDKNRNKQNASFEQHLQEALGQNVLLSANGQAVWKKVSSNLSLVAEIRQK